MEEIKINGERFARQISLAEIGEEGQKKLKSARVTVIGAGGLGCPALIYLAGAGIGSITVVDDDTVSLSNLHRQILFDKKDVGEQKALQASEILCKRYPDTMFRPVPRRFDSEIAKKLAPESDVIIDGTDGYLTKYLLSDYCTEYHKPFLSAAVLKWEGYIGGYCAGFPSYRDVFPEPPKESLDCNEAGVLGPLPGMFGAMLAAEAIKIILGVGSSVSGRLTRFDMLSGRFSDMQFDASGTIKKKLKNNAPSVVFEEEMTDNWELIDIRNENEFNTAPPLNNARLLPLAKILTDTVEVLSEFRNPLFLCAAGKRAERAALAAYLCGKAEKIGILRGGYQAIEAKKQAC